jgi:signal transduction histidine kinase
MKAGRAPDIQALDKALATMDRQLGKLGRLVDQLLETVRIQSGRLRLDLEATDLSALLARMVDEARARSTRHDLVVTAPGPVWARVDPLRIEQVVNNLLDNAIKFSPEGGKVEVDIASLCPDRVTFSVRDQGIGVAPPHRDHLFERFYQAHSSDHRSGMGLGLFISREIVEAHGGTIDAEFPETGGTRLVVELPANLTVPDRVNT